MIESCFYSVNVMWILQHWDSSEHATFFLWAASVWMADYILVFTSRWTSGPNNASGECCYIHLRTISRQRWTKTALTNHPDEQRCSFEFWVTGSKLVQSFAPTSVSVKSFLSGYGPTGPVTCLYFPTSRQERIRYIQGVKYLYSETLIFELQCNNVLKTHRSWH